ncbi:MAG: glycosyltransferase [Armatimonadetes bacterium]|nr:glycosyltransferase [Armatimonadota bacterium]
MRVLAVTSLYPTLAQPHFAAFMPGRMRGLAAHANVDLLLCRQTHPLGYRFRLPTSIVVDPLDQLTIWPAQFIALRGVARSRRARQMLGGARRAVRQMDRSWDVVLGHFLVPDGVCAALLAAELGLPVVLVAHGSDVHTKAADPRCHADLAWALGQAKGLIVVSDDLRRRLADLGFALPPTTVLPCGYDPALFAPRSQTEARARLGFMPGSWLVYVGALRGVKRLDVLLQALALVPDVHLAVVGDGDQAQPLRSLARSLGLDARVHWAGARPHDEVPDFLAAADAVVLSSDREGTPTILTEALAMGRPVVATAVGGIPELVGDLARLAPPGQPQALAQAIAGTLAAPPPSDRLRNAVAHLTLDAVGRAESEFLRACIEE